jgi:hypothetical protein
MLERSWERHAQVHERSKVMMTAEEVLFHVRMGNDRKAIGSVYLISPNQFRRLKESLEYHLKMGELVQGEYGLMLKQDEPEQP